MTSDFAFHEELRTYYHTIGNRNPNKKFVLDGILDIEAYNNSKYRILWILKEAYGNGYIYNTDIPFEYPSYVKNNFVFQKSFPTSGPMWAKIIYTNFGLLNEFILWDEMPNLWESESVFYSLKNCALINLKKIPGETQSNISEIRNNYEIDKSIIKKQIEILNPKIVICGGVASILKDDFSKEFLISNDLGISGFLSHDDRLFVDAYHPSAFVKQQDYCNQIIKFCQIYLNGVL